MTSNVIPLRAQIFGASPAEWMHFQMLVGTVDLLPVVSRPGAEISEGSTLKGIGKTPSRYDRNRKVVGFGKWTEFQATDDDVERWAGQPDYGICVQTREIRAFDIDVGDEALAGPIRQVIARHLGKLPGRSRSGTARVLFPFRLPGDIAKRVIRVEGGIIEFLASGQQFVAVGTHTSGDRYEWEGGLPVEIPTVTPSQFEALWVELVEAFGISSSEGDVGLGARGEDLDIDDPVVEYLAANWPTFDARGGKLFVECPWKDGHSGDSGPSQSAWLMAGSRGYQLGHYECRHATCSGYTDEDFLDAVGYRANEFQDLTGGQDESASGFVAEPAADGEPVPWPKFTRDGKGRIEATLHNVGLALERPDIFNGPPIRFDTFRDTTVIGDVPFRDADAVLIRRQLERRGFKPIGREMFRDALLAHAEEHEYDSAQEWLRGLPAWDGVPRVDTFYPRLFMTEDTPYTRAIGRYTWSALVARIVDPGSKADMVVLLQGEQSYGKSTGVKLMAPSMEMYRELSLHNIDADLSRKLRGCIVGELAELRGLRSRDAETIKAWIVQQDERWTPKYMEREISFPRRCIFFGTSNPAEILDDETGERRWLPTTVRGPVDLRGVQAERDQLWAEGLMLYELGGLQFADAERLAKAEHVNFKVRDSWEELIEGALHEPDVTGATIWERGYTTVLEVATAALGLDASKVSRVEERRIGKVMRSLGFVSRSHRIDGKVKWAWVRDV